VPDTSQLIARHAARLKKLLARHKAGKKLSPEELKLLGAGADSTDAADRVPTSYDSMASAAAALDIPKGTLQWAKDQGAPGFKGSRVYPLLLLPWLANANKEKGERRLDKRSLECELLQEKLEALREQRARARGLFIEWAAVEQWQLGLAQRLKLELSAKLKNELPPKLEGLRAPEIAAKMDGLIGELVDIIRQPVTAAKEQATSSPQ